MFRTLTVCVLLACVSPEEASAQPTRPSQRDALALAVQRFDPERAQGLRADDEPVRFMMAALEAVVSAYPEMRGFGRNVNQDLELLGWDFINSSSSDPSVDTTGIYEDRLLISLARNLSAGCPVIDGGGEPGSATDLLREESSSVFDLSGASCDGPWADAVRASGPLWLRWFRGGPPVVLTHMVIQSDPANPRDMVGVIDELRRSSNDLADALGHGSPMLGDILNDPVRSIHLYEDSPSDPYEDAFQLEFGTAWGDCIAGCINRHWWVYLLTPRAPAPGLWGFDVELVGEGGDPLGGGQSVDPPNKELLLTR